MAAACKILPAIMLLGAMWCRGASAEDCAARPGETCAAEDMGLLQVKVKQTSQAVSQGKQWQVPGRRQVVNLGPACAAGVSAVVSNVQLDQELATGGSFAYDISDITGGGSCSGSTNYGPNDCCVRWGQSMTVSYQVQTQVAVSQAWKVSVTLQIEAFLLVRWARIGEAIKVECALCDAVCRIPAIEVLNQMVFEEVDVEFPACSEVGNSYSGELTLELPVQSPAPVRVRIAGEGALMDGSGKVVAQGNVNAEADPAPR